ncbi:Band 4.1-like protein 4 [Nymphon striatum]|nr:Band 4.1-like protein 4 [Nymphon striatum]
MNKQALCTIVLATPKSARGQELLDVVIKHLNLIETAYFGLRYVDKNSQTHWLDPTRKIIKQLRGTTGPYTLYFGVKFYSSDPCKLVEEITRYQFFLQVKQDILLGRFPVETEMVAQLFAYAVQSELGDFDPQRHLPGYISEFRFIANQTVELESKIAEFHQHLLGQVPAMAEHAFLEKVKWLEMYGVDLHPVLGEDNIEYYLGLTPSGVIVLRNQAKVGNYYWPRITKVYFKGKYFMLRVRDKSNDENTYGFELPTKQACKHLWKCCVEHHTFFRLTQVRELPQQRPKLFHMGSNHSQIQTEKMAQENVQKTPRLQPAFSRKPSKRYQRRSGPPDGADTPDPAIISSRDENKNNLLNSMNLESIDANHKSTVPNTNSVSHTNINSTAPPWVDPASQRGLYTNQAPDSPRSVKSAGGKPSTRFPLHRRTSVESEASCDSKHHKHHRHRSRNPSDNDSEVSKSSRNSKSSRSGHRRKHRSRSSRHKENGSDSDYHHKHRHRRHRSDNSVHELVDSESQWRDIQQYQQLNQYGTQNAVIKNLASRKSGYVNSGMETESEACYRSRKKHRRRSRSRSKSPDNRHRPPEELRKYIEYKLIDPKDLREADLHDIKYTKIETEGPTFKIKYSPKGNRHRHKSPKHSRHSLNDKENLQNGKPANYMEDVPPPPYSPLNSTKMSNGYFVQPAEASTTHVSMATTSKLTGKDGISSSPAISRIQMYGQNSESENPPEQLRNPSELWTNGDSPRDYRSQYSNNNHKGANDYGYKSSRDVSKHEMSTELSTIPTKYNPLSTEEKVLVTWETDSEDDFDIRPPLSREAAREIRQQLIKDGFNLDLSPEDDEDDLDLIPPPKPDTLCGKRCCILS